MAIEGVQTEKGGWGCDVVRCSMVTKMPNGVSKGIHVRTVRRASPAKVKRGLSEDLGLRKRRRWPWIGINGNWNDAAELFGGPLS